MTTKTGAEIVAETLKNAGVRHVFGIVSIHNMPIVDAISRLDGIDMLTPRNEQSATHMADGYARATGKLGVSLASTGPGTTNTVTGLYEAAYASSRVLVVTGQADSDFYGKGKGFVHEAEMQVPMLETVARKVASPRYVDNIAGDLKAVIEDICNGRPQPGAIEIPIDLQYAYTEVPAAEIADPFPVAPDPTTLTKAEKCIREARKIVILAGGGIALSGASTALVKFAEKLNATVLTTTNGKGAINNEHPLLLGAVLMSGPVIKLVNEADLLIAVGTRFQAGVGGAQVKIPLPPILHIDVDPRNINLNYTAKVGLIADAKLSLESLNSKLNDTAGDNEYNNQLLAAAADTRERTLKRVGPDHTSVLNSLSQYMNEGSFFVRDSTIPGYYWANTLLPISTPGGYITPTSGAIGPGLPTGIGVAVATGKKTIIMHGDGGFMYHVGELTCAAQYQIPIVVVIFNDGGYGVLRGLQSEKFDGRYHQTELYTPDFIKMAESMGVRGLKAENVTEFNSRLAEAMEINGPVLIEINVHNMEPMKGIVTAPKQAS
ncbi:MAG: thiamine pyrophosphate-binding protein [Pseudomonadales bacterium]|nr:thiamine pyrophosphate-binding protein [Pseudomonadales bacterium]